MSLSPVSSDEEAVEESRLRAIVRSAPTAPQMVHVDNQPVKLAALRKHLKRLSELEGREIRVLNGDKNTTSIIEQRTTSALLLVSPLGVASLDKTKDEDSDTVEWILHVRGVWEPSTLFTIEGCPSVYIPKAKSGFKFSIFPKKQSSQPTTDDVEVTWSCLKRAHSSVFTKDEMLELITHNWAHNTHLYFAKLKFQRFSVLQMNQNAYFECLHCHQTFDSFTTWHEHFPQKVVPTKIQWHHLLFRDGLAVGKPVTLDVRFKVPSKSCPRERRKTYLASKSPSPSFFASLREKLVVIAQKTAADRRPVLNPSRFYELDTSWRAV